MFEALLEKLLSKYLGRFISGLDKNNLQLGVWSGNIVIENVNIKQDMLQMLNLPFEILFSSIGKLQIIIPWTSLNKDPVEVYIEDIQILTKRIEKQYWKFEEKYAIMKIFDNMQKYAKKLLEQIQNSQNLNNDNSLSYTSKIALKIIDNIQLKISNIHMRFEELDQFSIGLCLDQLEVFTTDNSFKKQFFDRTLKENKSKPINKILQLQNLYIYHNSEEHQFLSKNLKEQIVLLNRFQRISELKENIIININTQIKLTQNNQTSNGIEELPCYLIQGKLEELYFKWKNLQLTQLASLIKLIKEYRKNQQYIQNQQLISIEEAQQYSEVFIQTMKDIIKNDDLTYENHPNADQFEIALGYCPQSIQKVWVQEAVKEYLKETKIVELEKNKKKKWFFGKSEDVTEDDINQIHKMIDDQFTNQNSSIVKGESIKFKIILELDKGHFCFEKQSTIDKDIQNQVLLQYENFYFDMSKAWNGNSDINLDLQLFRILMVQIDDQVKREMAFLSMVDQQNSKFLEIKIHQTKNKKIQCKLSDLNWIYRKQFLEVMTEFIDKPGELTESNENEQINENLRQQTLQLQKQKLQSNKESSDLSQQNQISQIFDIYIGQQTIAIPLGQQIQENVFIIYIQKLEIQSLNIDQDQEQQKQLLNSKNVVLKNFSIKYQYEPSKDYNILNQYTVNINISEYFDKNKISMDLPILEVQLTEDICDKVIVLKDQFTIKKKDNDKKQQEKLQIQEQQSIPQLPSKNKILQVSVPFIQFRIQRSYTIGDVLQLRLQNFNIYKKQTTEGLQYLKISIQTLQIIDYFFKFNNNNFQPFLKMEDSNEPIIIEIKQQIDIDQFDAQNSSIDEFSSVSSNRNDESETYFGKMINVTCNSELLVNWKPDTIIGLKNFFKKMFTGKGIVIESFMEQTWEEVIKDLFESKQFHEKKNFYDTATQTIRGNERKYEAYNKAYENNLCSRKKLHVNLFLKKVMVNLLHRTSHCQLARLIVDGVEQNTYKTKEYLFVEGQIKDVTLQDMTNYPWTIDNNIDIHTEIKPYNILSRIPSSEAEYTAEFYFVNHLNESLEYTRNTDRVDKQLTINVDQVDVVYQHQVLMRIIDYITNQIVFLLIKAEQLIMNDTLKEGEKPRQVYDPQRNVIEKFFSPTFLLLDVNVNSIYAYFKPWPWEQEYLRLPIGKCRVRNVHYKDTSRFKNGASPIQYFQELQQESYLIDAEPVKIQFFDGTQYTDVTSTFRFNMDFGRAMWVPDIFLVWNKEMWTIDRKFLIRSAISPIIFKMFRNEYLNLVKGIVHNFTFDDQQDIRYNHNWLIQKGTPQGEMTFWIDFPDINIYLMNILTEFPFASLFLKDGRFKFEKYEDSNKQLKFLGRKLWINFYEYFNSNQELINKEDIESFQKASSVLEACFIGDISRHQQIEIIDSENTYSEDFKINSCFVDKSIITQDVRDEFEMYYIENYNEDDIQLKYHNYMDFETGNKDMELAFNNLKIYAKYSTGVNIFFWTQMEQQVFPNVPWYGDLNRICFQLNCNNVNIVIPNYVENFSLVTTGQVSYMFLKQKMPAHENIQKMLREKKINKQFLEDLGDLYTNSVTVQNFEIYRCDIQEIMTKAFAEVRKRCIVSPFDLYWAMKWELAIFENSEYLPTYFKTSHQLSTDKLSLNFSYKDTIVFKNLLDFIKQESTLIRREPASLGEQQLQELKNRDKDKCPQMMHFDCIIHNFSACFINDAMKGCVPVAQLSLNEIQLVFEKNSETQLFSAIFAFQSSFYNNKGNVWEPIIEKSAINIDLQIKPNSQQKKYMVIELNPVYESIKINISLEMVDVISYTLKTIQQQMKDHKEKQSRQILNPRETILEEDIEEDIQSVRNTFIPPQEYRKSSYIVSTYKNISHQLKQNSEKQSEILTRSNFHNKLKKEQTSEKQEKEPIEYVSPYTIYNEIGYPIEIGSFQKNDQLVEKRKKQYIIPAYGNINFQVEGDIGVSEDSGNYEDNKKIKINLVHPVYKKNLYLDDIHLDQIKKYKANFINQQNSFISNEQQLSFNNNQKNLKNNFVIENVRQQQRKIMIIRSNFKFQNCVSKPIQIKLVGKDVIQQKESEYQNNDSKELQQEIQNKSYTVTREYDDHSGLKNAYIIQPGQSTYLPFDKLDHCLQFRYLDIKKDNGLQMTQSKYFERSQFLDITESHSQWSPLIDLEKLKTFKNSSREIQNQGNDQNYCCQMSFKEIQKEEYSIIIEPSIVIKNCIPSLIKFKIFQGEKHNSVLDGTVQQNELIYGYNISLKQKLYLKLGVQEFYQSDIPQIHEPFKHFMTKNETGKENNQTLNIGIIDQNGKKGYVKLTLGPVEQGAKRFFLHLDNYIINQTPYKLYHFYSQGTQNQRKNKLRQNIYPGQKIKQLQEDDIEQIHSEQLTNIYKKIQLLCVESDNLFISTSPNEAINNDCISEQIDLKTVGRQEIQMQVQLPQQKTSLTFQIGINITFQSVDDSLNQITKVIDISPKYIIVNQCSCQLHVLQNKLTTQNAFVILPNQKKPFHWLNIDYQKQVMIMLNQSASQETGIKRKVQDVPNSQNYGWSGLIDFENTHSIIVRNKVNKQEYKVIKSQVREEDHITYIVFSEVTQELNSEYVIQNNLPGINLKIIQQCMYNKISETQDFNIQNYIQVVKPEQKIIFGWDQPLQDKKVQVWLEFQDNNEMANQYRFEPMYFDFQNKEVIDYEYVASNINNQDKYSYHILIESESTFKKLQCYQPELQEIDDDKLAKENQVDLVLQINIKSIGVSIIGHNQQKLDDEIDEQKKQRSRCEIMYLQLKNSNIGIIQYPTKRIIQGRISFIQLDNNIDHITTYPVILTPSRPSKLQKLNRSHFRIAMEQNLEVQGINLFQSIRIALQPTTIKLTDTLLGNIINYVKTVIKSMKQEQIKEGQDSYFNLGGSDQADIVQQEFQNLFKKFFEPENYEYEIQEQKELCDWFNQDVSYFSGKTFINELSISNLYFNASFKQSSLNNKMKMNFILNIFKAIGIAFGNINDAPIKLNQICLQSTNSTTFNMVKEITVRYRDSAIKSLLGVLGSINIIGNPVYLFKSLGIGIYDVVDTPMTGFVKGPLEGSFGLVKGIGSLFKHSISGVFNTVESMTEAFGSGVSSVSQDSRYQNQRENIKTQISRHIFHGLYLGGYSLFLGFYMGLTGIIMQPVRGGRINGAEGVFKGIFKGSVGLFLKPISGSFDFIAKTSEGIKNNVMVFDDRPNEKRYRQPRIFYNNEQIYKTYNLKHSEIVNYLQTYKKQKYANITFIDAVIFKNDEGENRILLLSLEEIFLMKHNKQIIWQFDPKYLDESKTHINQEKLIFQIHQDNYYLKSKIDIVINTRDRKITQYIYDRFKFLSESKKN